MQITLGQFKFWSKCFSRSGTWPDTTDGPLTLIEWTDFHSLVERLPENERQTFDLIYYGGLTQEQAAEALGVAVRTVKRRWRDARLALADERRITA